MLIMFLYKLILKYEVSCHILPHEKTIWFSVDVFYTLTFSWSTLEKRAFEEHTIIVDKDSNRQDSFYNGKDLSREGEKWLTSQHVQRNFPNASLNEKEVNLKKKKK